MKKFIQQKLKDQKGMTLIELLAVIVIIAIIAAIAIPAIGGIIENSRNGAVKADFQQAIAATNLYVTEKGTLPTGTDHLPALKPYIEDVGSLKTVVITRDATTKAIEITGTAQLANGKKYAITSAMSNAELTAKENSAFTGETITP